MLMKEWDDSNKHRAPTPRQRNLEKVLGLISILILLAITISAFFLLTASAYGHPGTLAATEDGTISLPAERTSSLMFPQQTGADTGDSTMAAATEPCAAHDA
ncbi:hypothetical protein [Erythrobacter sp. EC-HK427]|uniref:hypothetical protein n=1 Tax=Erythrobacter sp. EC-HK427 TaxID=2038396 RepID=UPI00125EC6DC|nr:hypothetical protein [Erythrobacter sp. EC-HK427]